MPCTLSDVFFLYDLSSSNASFSSYNMFRCPDKGVFLNSAECSSIQIFVEYDAKMVHECVQNYFPSIVLQLLICRHCLYFRVYTNKSISRHLKRHVIYCGHVCATCSQQWLYFSAHVTAVYFSSQTSTLACCRAAPQRGSYDNSTIGSTRNVRTTKWTLLITPSNGSCK